MEDKLIKRKNPRKKKNETIGTRNNQKKQPNEWQKKNDKQKTANAKKKQKKPTLPHTHRAPSQKNTKPKHAQTKHNQSKHTQSKHIIEQHAQPTHTPSQHAPSHNRQKTPSPDTQCSQTPSRRPQLLRKTAYTSEMLRIASKGSSCATTGNNSGVHTCTVATTTVFRCWGTKESSLIALENCKSRSRLPAGACLDAEIDSTAQNSIPSVTEIISTSIDHRQAFCNVHAKLLQQRSGEPRSDRESWPNTTLLQFRSDYRKKKKNLHGLLESRTRTTRHWCCNISAT